MITFPETHSHLMKWPVVETVYIENLYPQLQAVHLVYVDLSMVAIQLLAMDVIFLDRPSGRCKILRNRVLTGHLYLGLGEAIDAIRQTYDPPAFEPLPEPTPV